jgi:acetoin utilization deacetylase AcuC-like enzyme
MKAFHCDRYPLPVPPRHRFPQDKYTRLRERLENDSSLNLEFIEAPKVLREELELAHRPSYVQRALTGNLSVEEQRILGFPWSQGLIERSLRSIGGTLSACRAAVHEGVAVNLAGGTHHAKADTGAGYCLFNDVAIAAFVLSAKERVERILIVDADVHQGDGSAEILRDYPNLYTFSIHARGNFPRKKSTSDLDIGVADGMGDKGYLRNFRDGVRRSFLAARPLLVIYLAGADPYAGDRLGRLNLSKTGLLTRDEILVEECRRRHVPLAVVMAGGYAPNVDDIVDIHAQSVAVACAYASAYVSAQDLNPA